jgi:hypothetical protein
MRNDLFHQGAICKNEDSKDFRGVESPEDLFHQETTEGTSWIISHAQRPFPSSDDPRKKFVLPNCWESLTILILLLCIFIT